MINHTAILCAWKWSHFDICICVSPFLWENSHSIYLSYCLLKYIFPIFPSGYCCHWVYFTGGENDFEKALDLYKKLKIRFLEGLSHLRKWWANHPNLRKPICGGEQSLGPSKILGFIWDEQNDNFVFDFAEICKFSKGLNVTKRNILKILAMFYDPVGVLQPIMINFKILFQQICRTKIQWDEEITGDLR